MAIKKEAVKKDAVVDKKPSVSSVKKPIVKKSEHGKGGRYETDRQTILCTYHKSDRPLVVSNYYRANSGSIFGSLGYIPVCKECCNKIYNKYLFSCKNDFLQAVYFTCRKLDIRYDAELANGAFKHANGDLAKVFGWYMSSSNSLHQATLDASFDSSDGIDKPLTPEEAIRRIRDESKLDKTDKQYAEEIKKRIGYDAFEGFAFKPFDLRFLYRDLHGYVEDDDLIADSFKLGVVIQLVISTHQIRLLDIFLSSISNNIEDYSDNMTKISSISQQRAKLVESVSKIQASNKWLGADNTASKNKLAGLLKTYREYKIPEVEESYFDMLTCEATKKVLDISNQSILQQINFSESTEADIFKIQRELIDSKDNEIMEHKETIRVMANEVYVLKVKLDGDKIGKQ